MPNARVSAARAANRARNGWGGGVTAVVDGPAWSARGLVQHDSRYPLKVEGAVQRAVALLLPGVSTASEFIRYFALYGALAAVRSSLTWLLMMLGVMSGRGWGQGRRWWSGSGRGSRSGKRPQVSHLSGPSARDSPRRCG
jgi:hypothetical protein